MSSYRDYTGEITGVSKEKKIETTKDDNNVKKEDKKEKVKKDEEKIDVPVLGKINAKTVSIPLLATVLGLVDGFNPCAMWILIFL